MQISPESPAPAGLSSTATTFAPSAAEPSRERESIAPNGALKIRTLIADDQSLCRAVLQRLLQNEPDIEIVGTSASGREAVEAINRLQPDLVFLDVQMPEMDGFDVVNQIRCPRLPVVIFVTANQEFAVKAFDVQAIDYLLKPCNRARLQTALQRVRAQLQRHQNGEVHQKLAALLEEARPALKPAERLAVRSGGRILFVRLTELDWVEAADNYVKLHAGQEAHLLRQTMTALESKLPAGLFLRISRSVILNVERVKELHPLCHGEYVVVLRDGTRLTLTRGYREKLLQMGVS